MIANKHVDKVLEVANSNAVATSCVVASWRRSLDKFGLDPAFRGETRRIESASLSRRRSRIEQLLKIAQPELDRLFQLVNLSGCAVLLTDADGIVVDERLPGSDAATFRRWGLCLGADWSEASEGTNGIGTCIEEERKIVIHTDQHFFARNTALSCMDAPIFGPDGGLLAVLDVSSARGDKTGRINQMISALVAHTAGEIENRYFHEFYQNRRIVSVESKGSGCPALIAVDEHDIVVGATRYSRAMFNLGMATEVSAIPAIDLLSVSSRQSVFGEAQKSAIRQALARTGGNVAQAARESGVGRATFYRRMKKLGISKKPH